MIAKLRACEHALASGVDDVVIVDGRDRAALEAAALERRRRRPALRDSDRAQRRATTEDGEAPTGMTRTSDDDGDGRRVRRAKRGTCCRPIGGSRSRSCAARACVCTTRTAASTSTCCRASASPRSATRIPGSRARSPIRPQTLLHTSNLFFHPLQGQLAERLAQPVRAAARVLLQQRHRGGRGVPEVRAPLLVHAGRAAARSSSRSTNRSTAARSARCRSPPTSTTATPFEPLLPAVKFVPRQRRRRRSRRRCRRKTAAIIAEPIQGEGGVRPLTPAFAAAITEACAKTGALFIADEVQSGLGRTGYPFYFSGARPASRTWCRSARRSAAACRSARRSSARRSPDTISFGDHGSTYGGNLLACRAGALSSSTSWSAAACSRTSAASAALRAAAARDRREAPDRQGGPRRAA